MDQKPPTYDELLKENEKLKAENQRLQTVAAQAMVAIQQREEEIARLVKKSKAVRKLDPYAASAFDRPAYQREPKERP
jgi:regulator of replication initiation timing